LNEADYDAKKDDFLRGNLMDQDKRTEFTACTGVALDTVPLCRPDESGCSTVTIGVISDGCSDCISNRDAAYAEQYTLLAAYNAINTELTEYERWGEMWEKAELRSLASGPVAAL